LVEGKKQYRKAPIEIMGKIMIIDGFLSGFPLKQSNERRTGSGQVASYGCQMDPKNWSLARIEHAPTCYSLPRVDNLLALNPKSLQIEIIEKIVIRPIFRRLKSSGNCQLHSFLFLGQFTS